MDNFDIIKDDKKNIINYILNFEDAVKELPIVNFNETSIEFPNMIVFSKEEKGLLYSMLNPGVEVFKVNDEDFKGMYNFLIKEKENVLFLDRKISPKTTGRLNLNLLKEKMIYMREYDDTFICNDVLFTISESEFHGTGMLTGRNQVFLLSPEEYVDIKKFLLK